MRGIVDAQIRAALAQGQPVPIPKSGCDTGSRVGMSIAGALRPDYWPSTALTGTQDVSRTRRHRFRSHCRTGCSRRTARRSFCYFCACNKVITHDHGCSARYLSYLVREMDLAASHLGSDRRTVQLHLGGGTPTFFPVAELEELSSNCRTASRSRSTQNLPSKLIHEPSAPERFHHSRASASTERASTYRTLLPTFSKLSIASSRSMWWNAHSAAHAMRDFSQSTST
ncbi:hypothetical protein B0G75_12933 [Paraburkholderia sp. BL18I3N2]|nr:hypothetical protein B0G75_12933 [Paraburkholderia sp. BL18I3N2]PRX92607.1 hypothetical protein B0G73_13433 [Paraburkholderia sp. BL25I1N1]TDY17213.1 hypothetical protein B0G81_8458 [Paraburkholderia sp. BL6665CI2N2]